MTTFYLIRHAMKSVSGHVLSGRAPNVHLSDEGRRQADRLADRLSGVPIDRIYSSPLERAVDTARPLAERLGIEVEITDAIGEIDFGSWTNKTVEELEPDARWRQFNQFRSGNGTPGGECMLEVQTRFVALMLQLKETFPDERIAMVSHSDPIKAAIAYFAGTPLDLFSRFEIEPASISTITIDRYRPKIKCVNVPLDC